MQGEREAFPATLGLAVLWILVFVAMCVDQGKLQAVPGQVLSGGISTVTSSRFGDITPQAFHDGQWWRALTNTFIHYSWLHLGFNLVMLYTLGRLMEPWFGWGGFLGIYCVIGFFGSVLAVVVKPYFGHVMLEHSGGGSGVLCGLIAMLAVVGWRSKTRFGDYVKGQMVGLLVFIAIMGMVVPNVGNFEHAGGAVVGAVLGFARHRLFLLNGSRWGRLCGIGSLVLLGLCAGLQARGGADAQTRRQEAAETLARLSARQETIRNVGLLGTLYLSRAISESDESLARDAALGSLIDPVQARRATQRFRQLIQAPVNRVTLLLILNRQVQALSASQSQWLPDEDRDAWEVVEKQIRAAASHRPYPGEIAAFRQAVERIIADLSEAQRRDQRLIQRLQVQINPPKRQPFGKQQGGRELTPP